MNTTTAFEDFSLAPTKQFTVRLAPDVAAYISARAKADQRSLAFVLMQIVRAEMAREAAAKKRKAQ
jgi:predicted HicB family RNase H-like nuclease